MNASRFTLALASSFLLLAQPVLAASTPTPDFTLSKIPDDVRAQQFTKIDPIPIAYVTDLNVSVKDNTVSGSFVADNTESAAIGNVQYEFIILKPLPDAPIGTLVLDDLTTLARSRQTETFGINANEKKTISFSYQAPLLPDGDYRFRVQLITTNDRRMGWNDATVHLSGATFFTVLESNLVRVSSTDPISKETKSDWAPLEGPNVEAGQAISLSAFATNVGSEESTSTVQLATKRLLISGEQSLLKTYQTITLKANESKELTLPITAEDKPGSYGVLLSLINPNGQAVSGLAEFRYVVKGPSASIASQMITALPQEKGGTASIIFTVAGAADRATPINGTLEVVLKDDGGELGRVQNELALRGATPAQGTATVTLDHARCGVPSISLTVKTNEGLILDTYTAAYPNLTGTQCPGAANVGTNKSWTPILAVIGALVLLSLAGFWLTRPKGNLPANPPAGSGGAALMIALAATAALGGLFAYQQNFAQANGYQQILYLNEDPNNPHEQVSPVMTINSPLDNCTIGDSRCGQKNSDPAVVFYSGQFTWINCDNHRTIGYFEVEAKKDGGKVRTDTNYQWEILSIANIYMPQTCNCDTRIRRGVELSGWLKLPGYTPGGSTTLWSYGNSTGSWRDGAILQDFTWVNFAPPATPTPSTSPTTSPTASPAPTPIGGPVQCSDKIDNDSDGLIDTSDPDCTSPQDPTEGSSSTGADAAVTIQAPTSVGKGSLLSYSLQIKNNGPQNAQGAVVRQGVPTGMTFNTASSSKACSLSGQTVSCSLGTLSVNETSLMGIVFDVGQSVTCNANVQGSATVSTTSTDPNTGNNSATSNNTTITCNQCQDGIDNDSDNRVDTLDPACHQDHDITKPYNPGLGSENDTQCSDTKDNEGDSLIDSKDPNCHANNDLSKAYIPADDDESGTAPFNPGGVRVVE